MIGAAAKAALIAGKNPFCAVAIREVGRPNASPMRFSQAAVPSWPTGAEPMRGLVPRQVLAMLDAPFYSRSAVRTQVGREVVTGVHEALDLGRFRQGWMKWVLVVRVWRRG